MERRVKTLDERVEQLEKDIRRNTLLLYWANVGVIACVLSIFKWVVFR